MNSEKANITRPTPGPSLCRKSTGTWRGVVPCNILRVPTAVGARGMICGGNVPSSTYQSQSKPGASSPQSKRSSRLLNPPSKGEFLLAITMLVTLFLGVFTTPVLAQSSEPLPNTPLHLPLLGETYPQLEEYIRIAVEENPELRSLHHLYEAEKERAREVSVLPDPELNIMYDFNPMMSGSQLGRFSVSAMQMFPWFGSLSTRRNVQKSAAEADRAAISVRQLEILRDLQITWFDIAEVHEQIRITEENIELVRELERLVEIRYETGRAAQADILRIQMEEERLKNRVENLQDLLNPLKAKFNQYLNRSPDSFVETTDTVKSKPILYTNDQIKTMVSEENPAFDLIDARLNALNQQNRLAKLDGRPSFGLGLEVMGRDFGPMSMFPDATESFIGMATVRLPIFRSRTRSQQEQITHRKRALDSDRLQTENRLMTDLESAFEEIRTSERNITMLNEELIPRAQQALDILSDEYSVGSARFDELLQMQRELLDLEFERIEAVVMQNQAVVRIESLIGGIGQ